MEQFFANSNDSLCLQVAQMPKTPDMAIFVLTTMTKPIILPPCACARGKKWSGYGLTSLTGCSTPVQVSKSCGDLGLGL
jgi:hypothetical protein